MDLLKKDAVKALDELVGAWNQKPTLFESKQEVRKQTNQAFTMFVNMVKPMMVPELADKFVANPVDFLVTGDQADIMETWSLVRDDCRKQMVDMRNFFEKKFAESVRSLEKNEVIQELQQQQDGLETRMEHEATRVDKVEKMAKAAQKTAHNIIDELDREERKVVEVAKPGANTLSLVLTDLITTIVTGAEGQIGRIRTLVMYLAGTAQQHALEAGVSEEEWAGSVADVLTRFRHSQEKRLKRGEIWSIVKRLAMPKQVENLYDQLKKLVEESEYESRNYETFKFQTWGRCARHRSTNQEEKESVRKKKGGKASEGMELGPVEASQLIRKRKKARLVDSVSTQNFEQDKALKKTSKALKVKLGKSSKWGNMAAEMDLMCGAIVRKNKRSHISDSESGSEAERQRSASSEEESDDE